MYLLIQSWTDKSGVHELTRIYESLGVPYNEFTQINLLSVEVTQAKILEAIKEAKAVIIGASALSYRETDSEKRTLFDMARNKILPVLKETIQEEPEKKLLGICFGHQLLAEALNAKVAFTPEQGEVGIETVSLTDEGEHDRLFYGLPNTFPAVLMHKDSVLNVPDKAVLLAYSKKCSIQAFRYGKSFYGVQFHPELEYKDFQLRLTLGENESYRKMSKTDQTKIIIPTRKIIRNFIRSEIGKGVI